MKRVPICNISCLFSYDNHQNKSKKPKYSEDDERLTLKVKYASTSTTSLATRQGIIEGIPTYSHFNYHHLTTDDRLSRLISIYRKMDDIRGKFLENYYF